YTLYRRRDRGLGLQIVDDAESAAAVLDAASLRFSGEESWCAGVSDHAGQESLHPRRRARAPAWHGAWLEERGAGPCSRHQYRRAVADRLAGTDWTQNRIQRPHG